MCKYCMPSLQVLSVSSAGPLFEFMSDVPALTLPAWRLQLTALLLLVPGIWQYSRFSTGDVRLHCMLHSISLEGGLSPWHLLFCLACLLIFAQAAAYLAPVSTARFTWHLGHHREAVLTGAAEEMRKLVRDAPLIGLSGISLAVHFGTWVWGLQHTSLPHSLLIMSSTPLVIAIGSLLLGQPLSIGACQSWTRADCHCQQPGSWFYLPLLWQVAGVHAALAQDHSLHASRLCVLIVSHITSESQPRPHAAQIMS